MAKEFAAKRDQKAIKQKVRKDGRLKSTDFPDLLAECEFALRFFVVSMETRPKSDSRPERAPLRRAAYYPLSLPQHRKVSRLS